MKTVYKYEVNQGGLHEFVSGLDEEDSEYLAQNAAEDYHSNHDGWEASWPLEITLFREDETTIGVFDVDRDVEPVFIAREVKK